MLGSIFAAITGNVILGWVGRRILEVGGILWGLFEIVSRLPPEVQAVIGAFLSDNWENVTLGALVPAVIALAGYVFSFRSTVKDHVVQGKKRIPLTEQQARDAVGGYDGPIERR